MGSVLPRESMARTSKVWEPSPTGPKSINGVSQSAKAAPSRRHSKLLPGSVEVNSKLGMASLLGWAGLAVMVVSGAAVSVVQV